MCHQWKVGWKVSSLLPDIGNNPQHSHLRNIYVTKASSNNPDAHVSPILKDFFVCPSRSDQESVLLVMTLLIFDVMDVMLRLRMDDFKPVNLSMTLWAFARLGIPCFFFRLKSMDTVKRDLLATHMLKLDSSARIKRRSDFILATHMLKHDSSARIKRRSDFILAYRLFFVVFPKKTPCRKHFPSWSLAPTSPIVFLQVV